MLIILQNLLKLQALDFGEVAAKNVEAQRAELRGTIPAPVIGHYDRLRVRGKKGIVYVRHQVCTGCHMHVPIGQITVLMRDEDVQLCENCGRYLCLPDPAETEAAAPVQAAEPAAKVEKHVAKVKKPVAKAAAKPRKRRAVAHAA
jgi:hypothetical protein